MSPIGGVLAAMIAIAVAAPIVAAFAGWRLRRSLMTSIVPAVALAIAGLASAATAWGGRTASGSDDVSNTGSLLVAAVLALMAGGVGFSLAALVTRVRGGSEWSRRA